MAGKGGFWGKRVLAGVGKSKVGWDSSFHRKRDSMVVLYLRSY